MNRAAGSCSAKSTDASRPTTRSRRSSSNPVSIHRRWAFRCGDLLWPPQASRTQGRRGTGVPEGDTIFRAARTLHRALAGQIVVRFESVLPALTRVDEDEPIAGRTIESVTSRGKHVLMRFSGGLTLRTHMRMNGSWHIYRAHERWRRPRSAMRVLIATDAFEAVGFDIPVAEFATERSLARQTDLRLIGPDLLADAFDEGDALARFRQRNDASIADALVNQRIVSGAGNIYKRSEEHTSELQSP